MLLRELKPARFEAFLTANGHEVLAPTNEYEVVRFRNAEGVGIVYRNKRDMLSFQGPAKAAVNAFKSGKQFRAPDKRAKRLPVDLRAIVKRDGNGCFYCGEPLEVEEMTREHLLSITHGGSNHIANMVIACDPCNQEAGHLSVAEKVRLRDQKRSMMEA